MAGAGHALAATLAPDNVLNARSAVDNNLSTGLSVVMGCICVSGRASAVCPSFKECYTLVVSRQQGD